jgi:hypothetical protein
MPHHVPARSDDDDDEKGAAKRNQRTLSVNKITTTFVFYFSGQVSRVLALSCFSVTCVHIHKVQLSSFPFVPP